MRIANLQVCSQRGNFLLHSQKNAIRSEMYCSRRKHREPNLCDSMEHVLKSAIHRGFCILLFESSVRRQISAGLMSGPDKHR